MASDERVSRLLRRLMHGERHGRELRALGERRRAALAEAERTLRRVEELLPEALAAGYSLTEIAELSAVSRPTLYALQHRSQRSNQAAAGPGAAPSAPPTPARAVPK